ncbi:MAG: hypothetical protein UDB11_03390 [Peptococcaceae bacterium]|nr:hypothetical protein [Peptococcaceae bacterium]
MNDKKYWPEPRPNLRVGKCYRFKPILDGGKARRVDTKKNESPFAGRVIRRYPTYYLIETDRYLTTLHANCIGIDIEAVEL